MDGGVRDCQNKRPIKPEYQEISPETGLTPQATPTGTRNAANVIIVATTAKAKQVMERSIDSRNFRKHPTSRNTLGPVIRSSRPSISIASIAAGNPTQNKFR